MPGVRELKQQINELNQQINNLDQQYDDAVYSLLQTIIRSEKITPEIYVECKTIKHEDFRKAIARFNPDEREAFNKQVNHLLNDAIHQARKNYFKFKTLSSLEGIALSALSVLSAGSFNLVTFTWLIATSAFSFASFIEAMLAKVLPVSIHSTDDEILDAMVNNLKVVTDFNILTSENKDTETVPEIKNEKVNEDLSHLKYTAFKGLIFQPANESSNLIAAPKKKSLVCE